MTPRVPHHIRHYIVVLNQQGFSQREIGKQLGIAASTVGRYLNPRVRFRAQRRDNDRYYRSKDQAVLSTSESGWSDENSKLA